MRVAIKGLRMLRQAGIPVVAIEGTRKGPLPRPVFVAGLSGWAGLSVPAQPTLALLCEESAIDVAFFDEPTANLDDHRRDNLAEQILNVKGFSQLFVISHDDTFERDTDRVVRVVKEDGISRVVEA
jgi:exonuclease SbcC